MHPPKFSWLATLLLASTMSFAQTKYTVSGTISDKSSGEVLIGATVVLLERPQDGATTNSYGFYSIKASAGQYMLVISFMGYRSDTLKITLERNLQITDRLTAAGIELQPLTVSAQRKDAGVTQPLMGVQKLSMTEIADIPVLFGEKDILKTMQLLPGIKSTGDGSSGFFVRGGTNAQNLILLDEAVVYKPDHLLGFFSTFNSDAIKDVTVYKGGMPADYGGRLSSVVDIKLNDGNNQHFGMSGGIGLIDSRLNIEGPIVKDEGAFTISARRTYADLFLKLFKDTTINSLYFYDVNAKANYKIGAKDRVYLSGYFSQDNLGSDNFFQIQYHNATGTARWNHVFNSQLFSNTSVIYSNYNYLINDITDNNVNINSFIRDFSLKEDLQYYINSSNKLDLGFVVTHHSLAPGILNAGRNSGYNSLYLPKKYSVESDAYVSHEWSPMAKLHIVYGLRMTAFTVVGPGTFYTYDSSGNTTDSATYSSGQIVKNYIDPEPRFSASWLLNASSSIKVSYTRNIQNLHLLSNSTSANPTDLWIPSSNNVKPEIADQGSIGYFKNFSIYEFSSEVYYKTMQHQIDYKNGAQLVANENVESELLFGKGRAYGWELYLKKKEGRLTGWVAYTLSRTEEQINGINNGSWYPATQDETHAASIVGIYKLNRKWTLSADWVYNTGHAVTYPSGIYEVNGTVQYYYTQRNASRMPAYHRLDLAATVIRKKTAKWESSWTFSLYNAYGRDNAYAILFQHYQNNQQIQTVQFTLFRIVPAVTWNFKF